MVINVCMCVYRFIVYKKMYLFFPPKKIKIIQFTNDNVYLSFILVLHLIILVIFKSFSFIEMH